MEEIIVIGGGGHAKSIIGIIKKLKRYNLLGYVDHKNQGKILGIKYLGNDNQLKNIKKKYPRCVAALGVGAVKIPNNRREIKDRLHFFGYHFPAIISPTAIINEEVKIGEGTIVHDAVVINCGTVIGNYAIINNAGCIDHDCTIGDFVHIAPGVTLSGGVKIGDDSLLGIGSVVLQYKTIGKKCLIGAGSVILEDCSSSGTYVGSPARRKKCRY